MDRFGSSKLRIVWACGCLLLAGLVFAGVQGIGGDGSLVLFGTPIPLGMEDPRPYAADGLARYVYTVVPATILLGGILPLGEWLSNGSRTERYKGLLLGSGLAFLHGIFLGQLAILPAMAASHRIFGNPLSAPILRADLNGVILGLQLLLWTAALGLVVKSNRALAILLAYVLHSVGQVMAWGGEYLGDLEVPKATVATMAFLGRLLPTAKVPTDPPALAALPLGLGGPLLLGALLLLLPGKGPKAARPARKGKG